MPLSREQFASVKRLLREARALIEDVRRIFDAPGANAADLHVADRLRRAGREIGSVQDNLESQP